ncbi:hypothetical protein ANCDUO_12344 [Ancylostoma duodenale]|uniref:Chondroitin proteoglycan 4 domain-containing protein n=1 Tax=Ancylostoma duodenale TaxID=51022 RepID=A0A0C2G938_9BILA|nr:hypothetical protein ANCDUO_12344 [Ancylostoma duodenale]
MTLLLLALLWLPLIVVSAPMDLSEDGCCLQIPGDVLEPLPISPLDGISDASSSTSNSFSPPGSWFTGQQLAEELESLPPCQRECAKDLHDTVGDVLHGGSYVNKYHKTCSAYKEARRCVIEKRDKCDENVDMFAMVTSGIKYMCLEQGKAFNASIECIDHNAHAVQGREVFQLFRAESALQPPAFGDSPLPFEPGLLHFGLAPQTGNGLEVHRAVRDFEVITGNACQLVECSLACMRTKYDVMCENHAGSLIAVGYLMGSSLEKPEKGRRVAGNVGSANGVGAAKEELAHLAEVEHVIPESPINADSNLKELIEEMYANETFADEEDRTNSTLVDGDDRANGKCAEK